MSCSAAAHGPWCWTCHNEDDKFWTENCRYCNERARKLPRTANYLPPRKRRWQKLKDGMVMTAAWIGGIALVVGVIAGLVAFDQARSDAVRDCIDAKMAENWERYGSAGMHDVFQEEAAEECGAP